MKVDYRTDGSISGMRRPGAADVKFRADQYGGPSLWIWPGEDGAQATRVSLSACGVRSYAGSLAHVAFRLAYAEADDGLEIDVEIRNGGAMPFAPERCELRLGIDTYMAKFPDWNSHFFPTMLRCEKTHAWGYMMTPLRDILVIAARDPVASWHHSYARADYDRGGPTDTGHRIYTTSLDLLNKGPLPDRHPRNLDKLDAGQSRRFRILIAGAARESDIEDRAAAYTGAPVIRTDKCTYEYGETAVCRAEGTVCMISPGGKSYPCASPVTLNEYGTWRIVASRNDRQSEACVHVRQPWSYYMRKAREATLHFPQKAATHTESWYGFFSAFLARKYMPDETLDAALEADFERAFLAMHHPDTLKPVDAALPGRIQNSAMMISLLADAYEATGRMIYLERAAALADHVIGYQDADGAYRSGQGVHYTCVIYIAKAILELYLAERGLDAPLWKERARIHYQNAARAIEELRRSADDIQTEGEMTFEDGMISCSSLQLGMFALLQTPEAREPYVKVAEYMLDKHRCLEASIIPDCRMRGATLRFWETMYDVMIPQNMMTSPHGWTSWKTYATYYLYLLTGRKRYLEETMDTLGACMQMVEQEGGRLRWAFVSDPYVAADVFVPDTAHPGKGRLTRRVVGEQYVDMVSDWWRAASPDIVVKGYAYPDIGMVDGDYQGGACDNDVHEHFKCLEETALAKAFVHQDSGHYTAYNCSVRRNGDGIVVSPAEELVNEVIVHLDQPAAIAIEGWNTHTTGQAGFNFMEKQRLSHRPFLP